MSGRSGIGLVGSVIVDTVYEVLEPGNLVYSDGALSLAGDDCESESIEYGTGGMALNNAVHLAFTRADGTTADLGPASHGRLTGLLEASDPVAALEDLAGSHAIEADPAALQLLPPIDRKSVV